EGARARCRRQDRWCGGPGGGGRRSPGHGLRPPRRRLSRPGRGDGHGGRRDRRGLRRGRCRGPGRRHRHHRRQDPVQVEHHARGRRGQGGHRRHAAPRRPQVAGHLQPRRGRQHRQRRRIPADPDEDLPARLDRGQGRHGAGRQGERAGLDHRAPGDPERRPRGRRRTGLRPRDRREGPQDLPSRPGSMVGRATRQQRPCAPRGRRGQQL
ncbi:MAG: hypothetical protein AVDCRST_MAG41-2036, partial [uncultured Corynebacteriales bacterium]